MTAVTGFLAAGALTFQGLFIDAFAGGGGASTGIAQAIGRDVDIAINHSPTAIAIHKANHPETEHHCQDIRAVWPKAATRLQPVAGVWFSPDCKEYSKAKGGPVKDRHIRALANECTVWLEQVEPTVFYLENVEEFETAAPLDENGVQIASEKGKPFKRLISKWRSLGYRVKWWVLRACDYGAPTSRKRLYIVGRRDGLPIVKPKPTHGRPDSPGVRSGKLLPYRTAAECIDWSIPCPSIFERKRELADATKRRIAHGIMRYVVNAARPFIIRTDMHQSNAGCFYPGDEPLRTPSTSGGFAVVDATLAPHITKFHSNSVGSPMDKEMPTVTGNGQPARPAGAMPLGVVGASLYRTRNGEREGQAPRALDLQNPMGTVAAEASGFGLSAVEVAPFVTYGQHGGASRPAGDPHHTVTASKKDTNGVVGATLVGVGGRRGQSPPLPVDGPYPTTTVKGDGGISVAAMAPLQNGERRPSEKPREQNLGDPASTIATGGKFAVIEAELAQAGFIDRQFGNSAGNDAGDPLGATTAGGGGKSAAVTAFLSSFYTSDKKASGGDPEIPLRTARAGGGKGGGHHAIVTAHIEQANGGPRNTRSAGRSANRPLSTATTTGSQQRIVETTLIEEGDLPPEMMERAVKVAAFLVKWYGTDGPNETAQSQAVDRPIDVITAKARFAVVTVTIDAVTYVIVDIGLRMLTPRELANAQGFPRDYVLNPIVRKFLRGKWVERPLTIAEQISAIGNSVCPPVARALVAANQPGIADMRMAA